MPQTQDSDRNVFFTKHVIKIIIDFQMLKISEKSFLKVGRLAHNLKILKK